MPEPGSAQGFEKRDRFAVQRPRPRSITSPVMHRDRQELRRIRRLKRIRWKRSCATIRLRSPPNSRPQDVILHRNTSYQCALYFSSQGKVRRRKIERGDGI